MSEEMDRIGTEYAASCSKCGGMNIGSYDLITGIAAISCFKITAMGIEPVFTGSTEVLWDSQAPMDKTKPFQCGACGELLSVDDLVLVKSGVAIEETDPRTYVANQPLVSALFWFIENAEGLDASTRNDIFFDLRERVRG